MVKKEIRHVKKIMIITGAVILFIVEILWIFLGRICEGLLVSMFSF